jgi:hypothetical protein
MTQLLVAHVKLKIILKLIKKFNPCVNTKYVENWDFQLICYLTTRVLNALENK